MLSFGIAVAATVIAVGPATSSSFPCGPFPHDDPHGPIPSDWGANVSCPGPELGGLGCVNRTIGSVRNGLPWACKVKSKAMPNGKALGRTVCC